MGVIYKKIKFEGAIGEQEIDTLFDSGASYSFIKRANAVELENPVKLRKPWEFETAEQGRKLIINEAIRLEFYIGDIHLSDEFLICETISEAVIIGASTMQKWRMKLDFENDIVVVDKAVSRLMLK